MLVDPIDLLARLVQEGKVVRHDGPYEKHYPKITSRFVRLVKRRMVALSIGSR